MVSGINTRLVMKILRINNEYFISRNKYLIIVSLILLTITPKL